MDYLIKLDIANAMPVFRDYLVIMNELVEHPDQVFFTFYSRFLISLFLMPGTG